MKIRIYLTLSIIFLSATSNCYADESNYKKLNLYLEQVDNTDFSKDDYNNLSIKVAVLLDDLILKENIKGQYYSGLPNNYEMISMFGPAMNKYLSIHRKNAQEIKAPAFFLGLAMLQDTSSFHLFWAKIVESSQYDKFLYLKMLALYGDKSNEFLPYLHQLEKSYWFLPVRKLSSIIIDKIERNEAKDGYSRYKLWKDLESITPADFCKGSKNTDIDFHNSKTKINIDEFLGLNKSKVNIEEISQVLKLGKNLGVLVVSDSGEMKVIYNNGNESTVANGKGYQVKDTFTLGKRQFAIASGSHFYQYDLLVELVYLPNEDKFSFKRRFTLGSDYHGILDGENLKLYGKNWWFSINKRSAVIEQSNFCGLDSYLNVGL